MPLYYFDIRDAQGLYRDQTGIDLPDMEAAIAEGHRALADMSRDLMPHDDEQVLEILIRDHDEGPVRLALRVTTENLSDNKT